jgi:uncharacterized protein involved in outer membrane biogenesis
MMKKIGIALVIVIALIAGSLLWLRDNLDGLVRDAIEDYGSAMTKAKVSVGSVSIDVANGACVIREFEVGNPQGFSTPYAFRVNELTLALDPASLTENAILVKKIEIQSPEVIYEKGERITNFDAIQKNIADYLGPSEQSSSDGKRLMVEEFKMQNAKAYASAAFMDGKTVDVDLPDLIMRDVGKKEGGITPGELGQRIADAMKKQLTGAISFDKLGKAAQRAGEAIGEAASGAADKIKSLF